MVSTDTEAFENRAQYILLSENSIYAHKILQKAAKNVVSFNQNARSSENYPIGEVIFLDVIEDGLVFSTRLEPQSGDCKLLGFFQDAEGNLFLP